MMSYLFLSYQTKFAFHNLRISENILKKLLLNFTVYDVMRENTARGKVLTTVGLGYVSSFIS